MCRHAVENAYYVSGARFPPSTVPQKGSSPPTRDVSRSRMETPMAVVNSATSLFLRKKMPLDVRNPQYSLPKGQKPTHSFNFHSEPLRLVGF